MWVSPRRQCRSVLRSALLPPRWESLGTLLSLSGSPLPHVQLEMVMLPTPPTGRSGAVGVKPSVWCPARRRPHARVHCEGHRSCLSAWGLSWKPQTQGGPLACSHWDAKAPRGGRPPAASLGSSLRPFPQEPSLHLPEAGPSGDGFCNIPSFWGSRAPCMQTGRPGSGGHGACGDCL